MVIIIIKLDYQILVQMKSTGLRKPTPVGQATDSTPKLQSSTSEIIDESDPIAVCVQQRETLGGPGNQCTDAEARKNKFKVFKLGKLAALKGATLVDFVGGSDSNAGPSARSATAPGSASSRIAKPPTRPGTAAVKPVARSAAGAKKTATSTTADE